ncbi:MAG TPA: cupin domain-containing protein [Trebonia sp.]|jgi:quercetin dioxygenase-like cupin family protein
MGRTTEPSAEEPITRTVVSDVRLPAVKATDRVQIREIRIAPSQPAGLHVHNGPVFGSIVAGSVVYQIDGQPAAVLRPGDVFYEPEGARIARFDAQEDGVTFLAYFLLSPGQEPELTQL